MSENHYLRLAAPILAMNLKDTVEKVCHRATTSRPHTFTLKTLESAAEKIDASKKILVRKTVSVGVEKYEVSIVNAIDGAHFADVNLGEIFGKVGAITNLAFSTSTYGQVKIDKLFELLYNVEKRLVNYISSTGPETKMESTAPCQICGVVQRVSNLTVDHQRPQTGGAHEAVLKTFRAFGLTKEGPKGQKGLKILAHLTSGAAIGPVETKPGRALVAGTSKADRYTLNDTGAVIYSMAVEAGELETLKTACMHGLLNLQPACNSCNSSRGQKLKF